MSAVHSSAPDIQSGIGAWTHIVEPLFHAAITPMTEWGEESMVGAALEWEKATSIAAAQQAATIALLVRSRVADARAMELTRQDGSTYRMSLAKAQEQAVAFTATEFAAALTMTQRFAQDKVADAIALFDDNPMVWSSLNRGEICAYKARIITEELACLDADKAANIVDDLLVAARGKTPAQLRYAARHAVLKADPEAAMRRYDQARKKRRVTTRVVEDAMGWFSAFLNVAEMTELMGTVDAYARMLPADEGRTLDNRRADALVGLIRRGGGLQSQPASSESATTDAPSAEDTPADEPTDITDPFEQQLAAEAEAVPAGARRPEGNPLPGFSLGLKPKSTYESSSTPAPSWDGTTIPATSTGPDRSRPRSPENWQLAGRGGGCSPTAAPASCWTWDAPNTHPPCRCVKSFKNATKPADSPDASEKPPAAKSTTSSHGPPAPHPKTTSRVFAATTIG